jgi:hypothetical protein
MTHHLSSTWRVTFIDGGWVSDAVAGFPREACRVVTLGGREEVPAWVRLAFGWESVARMVVDADGQVLVSRHTCVCVCVCVCVKV